MQISNDVHYLTAEEMAAKLRISLRKLQGMVKAGTAPKHTKVGNKVLFVVGEGNVNV